MAVIAGIMLRKELQNRWDEFKNEIRPVVGLKVLHKMLSTARKVFATPDEKSSANAGDFRIFDTLWRGWRTMSERSTN